MRALLVVVLLLSSSRMAFAEDEAKAKVRSLYLDATRSYDSSRSFAPHSTATRRPTS